MGFFQGDIRLLPDDMKTLQPTVFPVVPRLLNRVYDKVSETEKSTGVQRETLLYTLHCINLVTRLVTLNMKGFCTQHLESLYNVYFISISGIYLPNLMSKLK